MTELNPNPNEDDPNVPVDSSSPRSDDDLTNVLREHMNSMLSFTFGLHSRGEAIGDEQPHPQLAVGGLYSVRGSIENTFQIAKVLVVEEGGVHFKLYASVWPKRPTAIAPDLLDVAPVSAPKEDQDDERWPISIGHLPFSHATFNALEPVFITQDTVTESELDGYRMWKSMEAEYF